MTKESFAAWAVRFEAEYAAQLKREEEERLKALPPKEREEAKRWAAKLSGASLSPSLPCPTLWGSPLPLCRASRASAVGARQATIESDAAFAAEGDEASVDVSQYERRQDESDDDEVAGAAGRLRLADLSDED